MSRGVGQVDLPSNLSQSVTLRFRQKDKAGAVQSGSEEPLLVVLSPAAPRKPGNQDTLLVPQSPDEESEASTASSISASGRWSEIELLKPQVKDLCLLPSLV